MRSRIPIPIKKLIQEAEAETPKKQPEDQNQDEKQNESAQAQQGKPILPVLQSNVDYIKQELGNSPDIVTRVFKAGENQEIQLCIVFTDGLSNADAIQNFILDTLMEKIRIAHLNSQRIQTLDCLEVLQSTSLPVGSITEISDFNKLFFHVLSGDTVLLMDGMSKGIVLSLRDWADRGVQEPSAQTVVRGPKDAFSETLRTNTALIRRRIRDPNLRLETKQIGRRTQTDVSIMYIKGVANDKIVAEVKKRLDDIKIDAILESGYIEELIQDETFTPFPTIFNSERPDSVASAILEGRVAILVDGTPFVLVVPALFVHFFQSSEDYYQRSDISTLIRILRYFAFFLALLSPSAYIAVTTFHQEMIPTPLLISLAAQREGVPFPAFVEAMIMEFTFEILREAGLRMPRAIGSSISIVGALVIGQAAVEAGIVSAMMVIVVSITALTSFIFPSYNMAITIRMLRFLFMILAASFGLFGITIGLILLVLHLNSLRSFGIPYMAPNAPFISADQKDNILRVPHWFLFARPRLINQKDIDREDTIQPKLPN